MNNVRPPCYQPLLDRYAEVLKDELGMLKFMKAHLEVQPQAAPKFCKPRPCFKRSFGERIVTFGKLRGVTESKS